MVRYHLGWEDAEGRASSGGGKAARATLCLLACEAAGKEWQQALPAAAAVELVHNFSLIHDDIQDRDPERHHRAAVWTVWGDAQAINAGDALLALARLAILGLIEGDVPARAVMEAARILDERTLEMVEGQVMDIEFERRMDVDVAAYLAMIEKKTGALFDAALSLGAIAGGAPSGTVKQWGRFGRLLGIGFQLRDDVMGIWGSQAATGKQPGTDIRRRKKSLPVVHAFSQAEGSTKDHLLRTYAGPALDDEDVAIVMRCLEELRTREYAMQRLDQYRRDTLARLDSISMPAVPGSELRELAEFLLALEEVPSQA